MTAFVAVPVIRINRLVEKSEGLSRISEVFQRHRTPWKRFHTGRRVRKSRGVGPASQVRLSGNVRRKRETAGPFGGPAALHEVVCAASLLRKAGLHRRDARHLPFRPDPLPVPEGTRSRLQMS